MTNPDSRTTRLHFSLSPPRCLVPADQDMAGRSRAKAPAIQILKTAELSAPECKRKSVMQMHDAQISFPLPHRVMKTPKAFKSTFVAQRPNTYY